MNEQTLSELRRLIEAATGSKDSDIAAHVIAAWLDAAGWRPVMGLRDEIAKIITPTGFSGFEKADQVLALLHERGEPAVSLPGHPGEWLTKGGPPRGATRWLIDLDYPSEWRI